jgi:HK97 family phage portal protein
MNPIQYIRETVGLGIVTEQFGARTFGSGTHPSMIITHPNEIKDKKAMRDALSEVYAGLDNSHKIMLLEDGMTATSVSITGQDSQYLETRKFQKSEIVDIFFGMPLTVMNAGENTPTYASAEQFSIGFIVYACMPWFVTAERGIYRCLLNPQERKRYYAKFQARGLQRGSFKDQMEGFRVGINTEILNPNECRELLDMNPYEGGEIYRTRTSTVKESAKPAAGGNEK